MRRLDVIVRFTFEVLDGAGGANYTDFTPLLNDPEQLHFLASVPLDQVRLRDPKCNEWVAKCTDAETLDAGDQAERIKQQDESTKL